jgi:hypothetical protein
MLGVTTLLGVIFEESEPKPTEGIQKGSGTGHKRDATEAGAERYPGLSICVQALGTDPAFGSVAKTKVETALLAVQQHRFWNRLDVAKAPPLVEVGCPSEPLAGRPGVSWHGGRPGAGDLGLYELTEPSFYRTFFFVMPLDQIDQRLGGLSVRVAPQEILISGGDSAGEETDAVFVSPAELQDSSFLVHQLTIAVGLESRDAEPSPE